MEITMTKHQGFNPHDVSPYSNACFTARNGIEYRIKEGRFHGIPVMEDIPVVRLAGIDKSAADTVLEELSSQPFSEQQFLERFIRNYGKEPAKGLCLFLDLADPTSGREYWLFSSLLAAISHDLFDPRAVEKYCGITFITQRGEWYKVMPPRKLTGSRQVNEAELSFLAGIRREDIHTITNSPSLHDLEEEQVLEEAVRRYGREPAPGLHLLTGFTSPRNSERYRITPIVERVELE